MNKGYFVQVGNCFVMFGIFNQTKMRADYKKATSFISYKVAQEEAVKRGIKNFKIVSRPISLSAEELCSEL